jgi:peptidyl-prolyl cis-trans isomerase C
MRWRVLLLGSLCGWSCATEPEVEEPAAIARVNGVAVLRAPFDRELANTRSRYAANGQAAPAGLEDGIRGRLIEAEIVRQQAQKEGLAVSLPELEARWVEHRARYGDAKALQAYLQSAGVSEAELKAELHAALLREKLLSKVGVAAPSEVELQAFFEANRREYDQEEQVRVSQILLRLGPGLSTAEKKRRRAELEAIRRRAIVPGADFAALAKAHSEHESKSSGGDLGWFPRGRHVEAMEAAAFGLKDQEVSAVIETPLGLHLLKKTGHRPPKLATFEEVRPKIERKLAAAAKNEAAKAALLRWKSEAKIELLGP